MVFLEQSVDPFVLFVSCVLDMGDFGPVCAANDEEEDGTANPEHFVHVVVLH